jgi:predicted TIM-barrel fold metal-dependent hydrolase
MIDDERFDPVFDHIAASGKTLVSHIGEPRNCWLPLEEMTVKSDRAYFEKHPQYHSYLHPEIPHYLKQIESRDNVLARHPDLRVIGCHLGSLEYDVDEVAKRLDRFPNFAVDLAQRVCHFQVQDRQKVRDFCVKYQDRILYGTDLGAGFTYMQTDIHGTVEKINATYDRDYLYFVTGEEMEAPEVNGAFNGLELPAEVLRKMFHDNMFKWYPTVEA